MAEPNTDLFSGSGATGVQPCDAANASAHLELVTHWANEVWSGSADINPDDWCRNPRSPISRYCNPGLSNKGYETISKYTPEVRDQQTNTLLFNQIKRCTHIKILLERGIGFEYESDLIKQEILGATSLTRAQYIKVVAARYALEPELIAGMILVEQRDQSEAADIADYISLYRLGRFSTSIGLGQVRATAAMIYGLLDKVITISPNQLKKQVVISYLLQDEALNINATAMYLRLLANAAVEVQQHKTNSLLEKDSNCLKNHKPANGQYENLALLDLSVMGQHSKDWSTLPNSNLPAATPGSVAYFLDNEWSELEVSQAKWDADRGHYYLRVLGSQYTRCPFTPSFLKTGVPQFYKYLGTPWLSPFDWEYKQPPSSDLAWALFLPIAYEDCKRSPLL